MNIHVHIHDERRGDRKILKALATLRSDLMRNVQEAIAAIAALNTATNNLATTTTEINSKVDVVIVKENQQLALIAELKAGQPVSQEQLDALTANAESALTNLQSVSSGLAGVADKLTPLAADPENPVPDEEPTEDPNNPEL